MINLIPKLRNKLLSEKNDNLRKWQEQSLHVICLFFVFLALPSVIKSIITSFQNGLWVNIVFYIISYATCITFIFVKVFPFKLKAWIIVTSLTSLGIISLFFIGPYGSGRIWFIIATLLASLILGIRAGILVLFFQLIPLAVYGYLLTNSQAFLISNLQLDGESWLTASITFTFLSTMSIVASGITTNGLSLLLEKTRKAKAELIKTTEQLNKKIIAHQQSLQGLMESEQRWVFALEGAGNGVWDWDLDTDKIYFSSLWKKILGYEENEIGFGIYSWFDHLHPEDRDNFLDKIEDCFLGKNDSFSNKYRIQQKSGDYIWVMDQGKVISKNSHGAPRRIIGSLTDITFIKKLEDEKLNFESRLQQNRKLEAIGTLAGGIAHDFNNILTPIIGNVEIAIRSKQQGEDLSENLAEIQSAARRAKALVKQILVFSREETFETTSIAIATIVKEVLKLTKVIIPKNIRVISYVEDDCGYIQGNATQIHQILMNLMTNATQAMKETGGELSISLTKFLISENNNGGKIAPGQYACLTVKDTGKGIAEAIQNRIFDPFFTTKQYGEGTGLGLSVVHGLVCELGGFIETSSQEGHGTSFKIYFPLTLQIDHNDTPAIQHNLKKGSGSIMVIEDEENVALVEKNMLVFLGYTVTSFTDSRQALKEFSNYPEKYDIILSDLEMPFMTGPQLAHKIKEIRPEIPVILCSGFIEKALMTAKGEQLFSAYLEKPITLRELSDTLQKLSEVKNPPISNYT